MPEPPDIARPTTSQRDAEDTRHRLEAWLSDRLGVPAQIPTLEIPESNGMSSETLLFDASWPSGGQRSTHSLVARVAPAQDAVPVFPCYDMDLQFRVMDAVRRHSDVPVPEVLWSEPDAGPLGTPFFIMARRTGEIPPDVMPYNFGSWLSEAAPADRARLQRATIKTLADLHSIPDPAGKFAFLGQPADGALERHVAAQHSYYDWVAADGIGSPLIERAFAWLAEHWPSEPGPAVLSWGDARIGNIMYADYEPNAVLDWEMAALAPAEVDLGWLIFLHRFFEDIAAGFGLPGMPDFLRRDDVADTYRDLTGHTPRDLDFYLLYAALRHAIIMFRIQRRAIHFGEATLPADPDEMIMHHQTLRDMLNGVYWEVP